MDSIFFLDEEERPAFFRRVCASLGCSYICLWYSSPQPASCLSFLDGIYRESTGNQQLRPSSSSGSLARTFFDAYCASVSYVGMGRIPGFAFKNELPYMELKLHVLQRMAWSDAQLRFYEEAGIRTVVFMACATGEIELGMTDESPEGLEMQIRAIFSTQMPLSLPRPQTMEPNPQLSSSSSSLKSLTFDSPECSSLRLINIQENPQQPLIMQDLSQIPKFPMCNESEDDVMTKAILAVLSSSTPPPPRQNVSSTLPLVNPPSHKPVQATTSAFQRNMNVRRTREEMLMQENRATESQINHMLTERIRRGKLNESFKLLRTLLPSTSKKDKASVLSSTTEYLISLKSQVEKLSKKEQELTAQLQSDWPELAGSEEGSYGFSTSDQAERLHVGINHLSSNSESRILDLRISLRSSSEEESSMLSLVVRISGFLQQQNSITLLSIESSTRTLDSSPVHSLLLKLKIQGDEFEESAFQDAVRRLFS